MEQLSRLISTPRMKMWGPSQRDSFKEITYKVKFKYDDGDYSLAIDLMSRDCINVYELITDRLLVDFLSKAAQAKIGKVFI